MGVRGVCYGCQDRCKGVRGVLREVLIWVLRGVLREVLRWV